MARGDECKTTNKANIACKNLDIAGPLKKQAAACSSYQQPKKVEEKKDYGSWGPVFKDKRSFLDMHHC